MIYDINVTISNFWVWERNKKEYSSTESFKILSCIESLIDLLESFGSLDLEF